MRRQNEPDTKAKKSRFPRTLAALIGIPLLMVVGAIALYSYHNRLSGINVPTHAMPADNAYDDFVKAGHLAQAMPHKSPYSLPGPPQPIFTMANFAAAAKDAEPALTLLQQGLNKPFLYPPIRSNADSNWSELAGFRELARTVSGVATYEERAGHPDQAMETRLDGIQMGIMIPRGGGTMPCLVGIACEAIAASKIERLLPQLSPQELAHAAERLNKITSMRTPLSETVIESGYEYTAWNLEFLRDRSDKGLTHVATVRQIISPNAAQDAPLQWQERWQIYRFFFSDKIGMLHTNLDYYKARAREIDEPYTGKAAVEVPDNLLAKISDYDNFMHLQTSYARMQTVEAILQTEIALYRYRVEQGRYPSSLAELTPNYLPSVPDDPFGGKTGVPLHYQVKTQGRSFLLYSLGPDLKDDGGKPQLRSGNDPGDIVAGQLWPGANSRY
ncbi:MAG TPA: hypothetical protein VKU00_16180 [Chthonomonadaceae bacterium]|nr:hypothetical protein [Chthonomonadaceae bacterium]